MLCQPLRPDHQGLMDAIRSVFLRAKHWQIFVLLFAIPQVAAVAAVAMMRNVLLVVVTAAYGLGLLARGIGRSVLFCPQE